MNGLALFGHTSGSKAGVVKLYQAYESAGERRESLEIWVQRLEALVRGPR